MLPESLIVLKLVLMLLYAVLIFPRHILGRGGGTGLPLGLERPVVAVEKLDLEVKKGSVTFLLGPNGGGKTTILKCVAGMVSMDAGSQLELNEAGLVFGICPQANVLWQGLTVQQHNQDMEKA